MADASPGLRARPLSPHVWMWRWHVTMLVSILHRFTGIGLYGGALLLAVWAWALASGKVSYSALMSLLESLPGQVVLIGLTFCVFYHLAAGIRHLLFDLGKGFAPATATASAWFVIGFAATTTLGFWIFAYMTGGA